MKDVFFLKDHIDLIFDLVFNLVVKLKLFACLLRVSTLKDMEDFEDQ